MATPDDIIEAQRIANARRMAQAAATPTPTPTPTLTAKASTVDPYYVRDPKTGLSPAQVEANKAVAEAAAATGMKVTPGATGSAATASRVSTTPITTTKTDTGDKGYWVHDASKDTTNPDGTVNWNEYWSTDPSKTRVTKVTPQVFGPTTSNASASSTDAALKALLASQQATANAQAAFAAAQAEAAIKSTRESAFALLKLEFDKYGLGSLVDTVKSYIMAGSPVEEVTLKLRATPEYQARFFGNQLRLKAGLNVYDEATYLQLENAYDQVFTSYGVTEAAGNTVDARRAKYAQFIGGTISPDEIKGRVQLAVAAANEDEVTKSTLRELYPSITDKDIVSYFLNPKETLPKLQTKVQAAQVGAAAVRQGLVTNVATAEELVAMGVTEAEAEKAYSAYAGMKPTLDLLSSLEKDQELMVNQQVAEGALLKGLASEQRKLEALRQKELGRFSGSSGTARGVSLGTTSGGTY